MVNIIIVINIKFTLSTTINSLHMFAMEPCLALNHVVKLVFFGIFVFQMYVALYTYIGKPTSTTTDYKSFKEIPFKPLITVCREDAFDLASARSLGYDSLADLLRGKVNNSIISWGAHLNKTHEEVIDLVYPIDIMNDIIAESATERKEIQGSEVYVATWGKCKQYQDYSASEISLVFPKLNTNVGYCVIISDPLLRNEYSLLSIFTKGEKICVDSKDEGSQWYYYIETNVDKKVKDCYTDYNERLQCLRNEAYDHFSSEGVDCVPPFLSKINKCGTIFDRNNGSKFFESSWHHEIYKILGGFQLFYLKCFDPCLQYEIYISKSSRVTVPKEYKVRVNLFFSDDNKFTSDKISYNEFNLIVEVGSALGRIK